jgi:hypothetical protein
MMDARSAMGKDGKNKKAKGKEESLKKDTEQKERKKNVTLA